MASVIVNQVEDYLKKTKVEAAFAGAVHSLLMQDQLSYNPYPNIINNLRIASEGFYLSRTNRQEEFDNALKTAMVVSGKYSFLNIHDTPVWGMNHLVALVDPNHLLQYEKLLADLNRSEKQLISTTEYKTRVIIALVGSAVFHGTFFDNITKVLVRLEYIISGNDDTEGLKLFIQNVLWDIKNLVTEKKHLPLNFKVPIYLNHKWEVETFPIKSVLANDPQILVKMAEAVIGKHYLMLECIFLLNPETRTFIRGCKQYVFNFLVLKNKSISKPILITKAPVPMLTAFEGIFLSKKHAEMYQSIMLGLMDQQNESIQRVLREEEERFSVASFKLPIAQTEALSLFERPPEMMDSSAEIYFWRSGMMLASQAPENDGGGINRSRAEALQMQIPENILNELRLYWKIRTVHLVQEHHHLDAIPDLLLYASIHIDGNREVMMDIFRLVHSTAQRMQELTGYCIALEDTLYTLDLEMAPEVTQQLRNLYGLKIRHIIEGDNHAENVEVVIWGQRLLQEISEIFGSKELAATTTAQKVGRKLKVQVGYSLYLMYQVLDGCLLSLPHLNKALFNMEESILEMFAMEPRSRRVSQLPNMKIQQKRERATPIKYGIEDDWILLRDQQAIVVSSILSRGGANGMSAEDLFARYVVDTHMDEMWADYLNDLILATALPANPYPRLLNSLRDCSSRMALDVIWDDSNTKALLHSIAQPDTTFNYLYTITGYEVYGHNQALRFINPVPIADMASKIKPVLFTDYKRQWGQYRFLVCSAIGGNTPLWGRMDPYLREIIVNEHCYMKGPERNSNDAIKLFAKFVFEHVTDLYKKEKDPIIGVFTGVEEEKWNTTRVFDEKVAFHAKIESCCSMMQPFYIKVYVFMDWRAVAVIKYIHLHFTNNEETYQLKYFAEDPSEYYCQVFVDKAKADFHLQYNNATNSDPMKLEGTLESTRQLAEKIVYCSNKGDWFTAHSLLLRHALVTNTSSVLPEVWKMFHSMAGRVDYIAALWRGISDLISYVLTIKPGRAHRGNIETNITHSSELTGNLYVLSINTNLMAEILLDETEIVMSSGSCVTSASLRQAVLSKLRKVAVTNEEDGKIAVIFDDESIDMLAEVDGMLQAIRDVLAYDVHRISPEAQAVVASLKNELRMINRSPNGGNVIVFQAPARVGRTWPT